MHGDKMSQLIVLIMERIRNSFFIEKNELPNWAPVPRGIMVSASSGLVKPEQVIVHPLVLLSVVDHYKRMGLPPGKRVVGVLLGQWNGHVVNVSNCYASNPPNFRSFSA